MTEPIPVPDTTDGVDPDGATPRHRASDPVHELPRTLGPYKIIEEIGRGGMGVVYKAFHPNLKRTVALKVLLSGEDASEEALTRFHREAEAVAKLGHHPNIVPVHDIGAEGKLHYFAMHYVEGKPLDRLIDDGEVAPKRAASIARGLALALQHAHDRGVLHRDIKPSNVLVTRDGTPQLTDFGLAKLACDGPALSVAGIAMGTPAYMPPEQALGEVDQLDERSDVYALGATLYEMLTLQPPFEGEQPMQVLQRVLTTDPVRPRRFNLLVDRDLETVCLKCLEKPKGRRYDSAGALAQDLQRFLDGENVAARRPGMVSVLWRRVKRRKAATVAVLSVIALLAVSSLATLWYLTEKAKERGRWVPAFQDDFERSGIGEEWAVRSGSWEIRNGALCCLGDASCSVFTARDFPGDVRIEYDARPIDWPVCSMSSILNGQPPNVAGTGYYMGFGDNFNQRSYILRKYGMIANNSEAVIEPDRTYHIVAQREQGVLTVWVDGTVINRARDFFPLTGEDQAKIGLYSYFSSVAFDNVKIYLKEGAQRFTRDRAADILFDAGAFAAAARQYGLAARDLDRPDRDIALFKSALSRLRAGKTDQARAELDDLLGTIRDPVLKAHCHAALAEADFLDGEIEQGWRRSVAAGMKEELDEITKILVFSAVGAAQRLRTLDMPDKAFALELKLHEEYGSRLLSPAVLMNTVLPTLVRQKDADGIRRLAERVKSRATGMKRLEADYVFALFLGLYDPPEQAQLLLESIRELERLGWSRLAYSNLTRISQTLAHGGLGEEARKRIRSYACRVSLIEQDEARARRETAQVLAEATDETDDETLRNALWTAFILFDEKEFKAVRERFDDRLDTALKAFLLFETEGQKAAAAYLKGRSASGTDRFLAGAIQLDEADRKWEWGAYFSDSNPWRYLLIAGLRSEIERDPGRATGYYERCVDLCPWKGIYSRMATRRIRSIRREDGQDR